MVVHCREEELPEGWTDGYYVAKVVEDTIVIGTPSDEDRPTDADDGTAEA